MSLLLLQDREKKKWVPSRMRRMSSNGVVWWCAFEQETITELGRSVRPHRSCSLGFPPLWGPKKMSFVGKRLEVMTMLLKKWGKWMRVQNLKWYEMGTEVLVSRWCKAVEVDGNMHKSEACNTSL